MLWPQLYFTDIIYLLVLKIEIISSAECQLTVNGKMEICFPNEENPLTGYLNIAKTQFEQIGFCEYSDYLKTGYNP